ncbi:MAG: insulinase family protein [Nitrospinae bacterium]|nr:insulinase family protein [Nitrospinota bacterium]
MRRFVFALAMLSFILPVASFSATVDLSALKYPQLKFNPPKPERVVLKNGMILYLLEDHELPVVDIGAMVRIGSAYVPAEKAGLAEITGRLWRAGGTKSLAPGELDERLEFMGASIETSIGAESGSASMKIMSKNLDEGLRLYADVIRNPAFDEKRFVVLKEQVADGLRRLEDEPDALVDREFHKLLFKGHPFGVSPTLKSVEGVSLEDCRSFYREHIGPESFMIGLTGDFKSADIKARFEKLFAGWGRAPKKFGKIPPVADVGASGIYLLDKKLPQTAIRIGHLGVSRKEADFQTVRVMNYVLGGGGFSSRLMKDVRSVRGLAYSVWSYFSGGDSDKGAFMIGGETKASTTGEFISVSRDLARGMAERGASASEVSGAKEAIVNSFIFAFDKPTEITGKYMWMEYYGIPKNYLETYKDVVLSLTPGEINEAAQKRIHPEKFLIVVVGDKRVVGPQLEKLGPVKLLEGAE